MRGGSAQRGDRVSDDPVSPHRPPDISGSERPSAPRGVQFVKFSFFRVGDGVRAADETQRLAVAKRLASMLERSAERMLTRLYSTVGTRADTDFLVWQVVDDLDVLTGWHAELLGSPLATALERPHSFLSMTMRSLYTNPVHQGAEQRDRLRNDGGTSDYLFVYPMAKTRDWYKLPPEERQRITRRRGCEPGVRAPAPGPPRRPRPASR